MFAHLLNMFTINSTVLTQTCWFTSDGGKVLEMPLDVTYSTQAVYRTVSPRNSAGGKLCFHVLRRIRWINSEWSDCVEMCGLYYFTSQPTALVWYSCWERGRKQDRSHTHSVESCLFPTLFPPSVRDSGPCNLWRVSQEATPRKRYNASETVSNGSF